MVIRNADPQRRTAGIEAIRAHARAHVERTSLRFVARLIGITPQGLRLFVNGAAPQSATCEKLRAYWRRETAPEGRPGSGADALKMLDSLLADVSDPTTRVQSVREIIDHLARIYDNAAEVQPHWLLDVLQLAPRKLSTMRSDAVEGLTHA